MFTVETLAYGDSILGVGRNNSIPKHNRSVTKNEYDRERESKESNQTDSTKNEKLENTHEKLENAHATKVCAIRRAHGKSTKECDQKATFTIES